NNDFGVLPFSTVSGTVTGHLLNHGVLDPTAAPQQGWTVVLQTGASTPVTDLLFVKGIDAGGGASGPYAADAGFSGGTAGRATAAIDPSRLTDPAPQAVYQTYRFGAGGTAFTYTVGGLTPGAAYAVRLHFAEPDATGPGQRLFNVALNGQQVLTDFDVFQAA